MKVIEIFRSIQGEGTLQGTKTTFIRLAGCNLRCSWCDTTYSYKGGKDLSVMDILRKVDELNCLSITVTGGEPLIHKDIYQLLEELHKDNYYVTVFTNGTQNIQPFHPFVNKFVVDYKLPSAKPAHDFHPMNYYTLRSSDELKFVISTEADYEEAKRFLKDNTTSATVLFSPCFNGRNFTWAKKLAEKMIQDNVLARYSLQLHKVLFQKERGR